MPARPRPVHVALLRGINVGGHKKVPMIELHALCEELGWHEVRTYIQSGNVVFAAAGTPAKHSAALAGALEERFGFEVSVIVRTGADWLRLAARSAFPDVEEERPKAVHLALASVAPERAALAQLERYCRAGERVALRGDALWIDYAGSVARSRLTPAVLDRVVGAPVTARNWRTVQAIAALVRGE